MTSSISTGGAGWGLRSLSHRRLALAAATARPVDLHSPQEMSGCEVRQTGRTSAARPMALLRPALTHQRFEIDTGRCESFGRQYQRHRSGRLAAGRAGRFRPIPCFDDTGSRVPCTPSCCRTVSAHRQHSPTTAAGIFECGLDIRRDRGADYCHIVTVNVSGASQYTALRQSQ